MDDFPYGVDPAHPLADYFRAVAREKAREAAEDKAWRYAAKFRANTRGVSMTPEDFEAQGRRHQRLALDVALIERVRTPERVQTGRAPRSRRTRPSRTSSRGDPDPSEPGAHLVALQLVTVRAAA
jgi:hypothetical protein